MSRESTLLQKMVEKIEYIEQIAEQYGSVENSLSDAVLGRAAVMMHIEAIAEQFEKLSENGFFEILSKFDANDVKGTRRVRNYIAHQYDEVDNDIIIDIIKERLPVIKSTCKDLLK